VTSRLATGGTVQYVFEHRPGHGTHLWRSVGNTVKAGAPGGFGWMGPTGREPTIAEAVEAGLPNRSRPPT
jgi:hypothetical protein